MKMNDIYLRLSPIFRRRRIERFIARFRPTKETRILDVGGMPQFWIESGIESHITMINLYPIEVPDSMKGHCEARIGDGMDMEFADGEFDIVFSNSVIEHLATWDNQVRMAREMRRVGKQFYVQTPAREFFFEPHLLTPFVHWLPKALQRRHYRHAT
ncbi:MAG: Methyltransferase type 11, partial [Akkermansiaceae bacterium]|nr:Methyltransferase type 11 [Akkermansiaceae bacterium]